MKCPKCDNIESFVYDSKSPYNTTDKTRNSKFVSNTGGVERRRECKDNLCGRHWTSYEMTREYYERLLADRGKLNRLAELLTSIMDAWR